MKILFLTNHLKATDGWSRYSRDVIDELRRQGHEVLPLVHELSGKGNEQAVLNKPLAYLANPWEVYRSARKVCSIMKIYYPDVIHVAVEPYGHMLPLLKTESLKTVLTVHGTFSYMPKVVGSGLRKIISRIMTLTMYERVQVVVSVSGYTKNYLLAHIPPQLRESLSDRVHVIHNGINLSVFSAPGISRKERTVKNLLFVGAIKSRKGLVEAVRAVAAYKQMVLSPFIFRIVGDYDPADPYVIELKRTIEENKLNEEVLLEGKVSEERLRELYSNADLFLMLSIAEPEGTFEGFGLTYLEANAYGVPTIGPDNSGAQEAISEGVSGYRVNVRKPPEVARIISRVLDEGKISREGCLAWAREHGISRQVEKLVALYR